MYVSVGNSVTLQLIRRNQQCNVTEELAPVDINLQYDFNFQQFTYLPREVQVLPVSTSTSLFYVPKGISKAKPILYFPTEQLNNVYTVGVNKIFPYHGCTTS